MLFPIILSIIKKIAWKWSKDLKLKKLNHFSFFNFLKSNYKGGLIFICFFNFLKSNYKGGLIFYILGQFYQFMAILSFEDWKPKNCPKMVKRAPNKKIRPLYFLKLFEVELWKCLYFLVLKLHRDAIMITPAWCSVGKKVRKQGHVESEF